MGSSSQAPLVRFGLIAFANRAIEIRNAISLVSIAKIVVIGIPNPERTKQRIRSTCESYNLSLIGSYDDVINNPSVDAVFVSLKEPTHSCSFAIAAARKGKHVLLEIPTALRLEELDDILKACRDNEVQFMDATMWLHHPRTKKMKHLIRSRHFGKISMVNSICTNCISPGVLSYASWHCISSILWAYSYELPKTAHALYANVDSGILINYGARLMWSDGRFATLHWSGVGHQTAQMTVIGLSGTLDVTDFAIPSDERIAYFHCKSSFTEMMTDRDRVPYIHPVSTELPQNAKMVYDFAYLALFINVLGVEPEKKWPEISRKTLLVIDAVSKSVADGLKIVDITD